MKRVRVLIVDAEPLARAGVAALLGGEPGVEIAGGFGNAKPDLAAGESVPARPERLLFKAGREHVFVRPDEIFWIEASGERVKIKAGPQVYLVRDSLAAIERRLDPGTFVRIHRSFIVNARRIKKISPILYGDYEVLTDDDTRLRMSRTHRSRLKQLLGIAG